MFSSLLVLVVRVCVDFSATFGFCLSGINLENSYAIGWKTDSGLGRGASSFLFSLFRCLRHYYYHLMSTTAFVRNYRARNSQIRLVLIHFHVFSSTMLATDHTDVENAFLQAFRSNSHVNFPITCDSSSSSLLLFRYASSYLPPSAVDNTCAPKFTAKILGTAFSPNSPRVLETVSNVSSISCSSHPSRNVETRL